MTASPFCSPRLHRDPNRVGHDCDECRRKDAELAALRRERDEARRVYPLATEIADAILRMRRGDYSGGSPLDFTIRLLEAAKRETP